jgi:hypothetical protein
LRLPLRLSLPATAATVAALAFAGPAMADAPKFHSADSSVNNAGALVADFDERGLGNENIDYTLTADATAVYACINGGNNHPQAANKESVSAAGDFPVQNGKAEFSLTATATFKPDCSPPMTVQFSDITVTDTTSGISVGF